MDVDGRSRRGPQRPVQRLPVADGAVLRRCFTRSGSATGSWSGSGWGRCSRSRTWGMLKLLDALVGRPRGVAHLVAAAFYLLNPYVAVFTARTSITLLGYAALPWLLLITYHGVHATRGWRRWRSWWWAAAFALVLTSTGGGVNAAVVGWMLVGPLVLACLRAGGRERALARRRRLPGACRRARACSPRCGGSCRCSCTSRYGIDFLQFTEQPATIWGTNSLTESLRLMGYWTSYIGVGFGVSAAVLLRRRRRCCSTRSWSAPRCCCRRWRSPASSARAGSATRRCCWPADRRRRGDRDRRVPRRHAGPRDDGVDLRPHLRAQLHAHDQQGGAAGRGRGRGPARASRRAQRTGR